MSDIDGQAVTYITEPHWVGAVLGDASIAGVVRVQWEQPERFIGIHRVIDLVVQQTGT